VEAVAVHSAISGQDRGVLAVEAVAASAAAVSAAEPADAGNKLVG